MTSSHVLALLVVGGVLAGGCTTSDVRAPGEARMHSIVGRSVKATRTPSDPAKIQLVEGDLTGKPYDALADISVVVRKTMFFGEAPTQETVARRLREEAAKLGADAVIYVSYGPAGGGSAAFNPLSASGRAVAYK